MAAIRDIKIIAIFAVLLGGVIGAALPWVLSKVFGRRDGSLGRQRERCLGRFFKLTLCVGIGIILATATIHMIPEGIERVNEGLGLEESHDHDHAVATTAAPHDDHDHDHDHDHDENNSTELTTPAARYAFAAEDNHTDDHDHSDHSDHDHDHDHDHSGEEEEEESGHDHGYPYGLLITTATILVLYFATTELNWWAARRMQAMRAVACDAHEEERMGASIKLHVLEAGVAVHSIIIGIALGAESSKSAVTTLCVAITMHQLFEGMALGGLLASARLPVWHSALLIAFYALATPIGIIAGMQGDWASPLAMGVFDMIAAGVLLHMALTDMLPHVSGTHAHHSHGPVFITAPTAVEVPAAAAAANGDAELKPVAANPVAASPAVQDAAVEVDPVVTNVVVVVGPNEDDLSTAADAESASTKPAVVKKPVLSHGGQSRHPHDVQHHSHGDVAYPDHEHHVTDDDHDDETFVFRLACWAALVAGVAIQAVIGIWA
jgi:zinc transporter 1/2/3